MKKTKIDRTFGIQTKTGNTYDPRSGEITEVDIEDVAHALSNICRYAGHCRRFYSVAEHSVLAANIAETLWPEDRDTVRAALLHDATEAYVVDLPTPIKVLLPDYKKMEENVMWRLAEALDVKWNPQTIKRVKTVDAMALATEVQYLFDDLTHWESIRGYSRLPEVLAKGFPLAPTDAKKLFMKKFIELEKERLR